MAGRTDAARIRAFRRGLEDEIADRTQAFPWGTLLETPSLADVYDVNFMRVERGRRGAASLARAADELQAHLFHRKVEFEHGGERAAQAFEDLGWSVSPHVVMALRREPDRRVSTAAVRERTMDDLRRVRHETTLREPWGNAEIADRLTEARLRVARARPMRHFAAHVGRRIAAYCELRTDGTIAQIEDVNTLEEFRGRGLGRALVQHVADVARRDHELVFLEALGDDWPRHLYTKLGFDVVDTRYIFLRHPHMLTGLRLRTPRLELRLATRAELRALAEVARRGIHPRSEMPFTVAWTDKDTSPSFVDDVVAHHDQRLAEWRRGAWTLNLVVFHRGRPIGSQSIRARSFARTPRVETGSWLGGRWQRRGLGTEMRAAALELAFRGLGAQEAWSGAHDDNTASLRVSEKLGYVVGGEEWHRPRGERVHAVRLVRRRRGWRSPVPVTIEGLPPLLPLFGAS